ncbi:MAG TPA: hypothetical protein VJ110_00750, partial [Candidatus Nanoarchaeia archaeon]|nr:hypothetical protein [Candidatus Nanoarchaeia archaeon]
MTAEILRGIRVNLDDTVSFYTTLNREKQRHTIPSEFIFASHRDDLENVQHLRKEVFESIGLEGEIVDSGYKKKTLHIRGNSSTEKLLKTHWRKFFKESLNVSGPEEYVMRYPIYSLLEFDRSDKPQVVGIADLKDIPGRVGALDIEKKAGKGQRYGITAMNTIGNRKWKQFFVLEENAPDSLGELQNVEIVPVETENEIVEGTREASRKFDTIVIHNAPFDIGELRQIKEKKTQKILTGEDGFEPHIRGHDFIRRVWHPEIDFIDTCKVSQYVTPNIRDTLDYAAAYFKSSKRKLLGSGDLEFMINNPTPENNRKVAAYNVADIDIVLDCGEKAIDYLAPIARFLGRSIGNIGAVSKYTSVQQARDREYWRNLNIFRSPRVMRVQT